MKKFLYTPLGHFDSVCQDEWFKATYYIYPWFYEHFHKMMLTIWLLCYKERMKKNFVLWLLLIARAQVLISLDFRKLGAHAKNKKENGFAEDLKDFVPSFLTKMNFLVSI